MTRSGRRRIGLSPFLMPATLSDRQFSARRVSSRQNFSGCQAKRWPHSSGSRPVAPVPLLKAELTFIVPRWVQRKNASRSYNQQYDARFTVRLFVIHATANSRGDKIFGAMQSIRSACSLVTRRPNGKWTSQAEGCGGQLALGERRPHIQSFHCYTTDSARAALGRLRLP